MKKIEDYLHLYLGCECEAIGGDDYWRNKIGKLFSIRKLGKYEADFELLFKDTGKSNYFHSTEIKPLLRPLSSMTEEEAREFFGEVMHFKNQFQFKYGFKYRYENGFHSVYDNQTEQWYPIIKPSQDGRPCFNCTYAMEEVLWLLKKSFDLFNLIESGLALDATQSTHT